MLFYLFSLRFPEGDLEARRGIWMISHSLWFVNKDEKCWGYSSGVESLGVIGPAPSTKEEKGNIAYLTILSV